LEEEARNGLKPFPTAVSCDRPASCLTRGRMRGAVATGKSRASRDWHAREMVSGLEHEADGHFSATC